MTHLGSKRTLDKPIPLQPSYLGSKIAVQRIRKVVPPMTSLVHVFPDPVGAVLRPASESSTPEDGQARRRAYIRTTAETAECTCPEFCERDHGNE